MNRIRLATSIDDIHTPLFQLHQTLLRTLVPSATCPFESGKSVSLPSTLEVTASLTPAAIPEYPVCKGSAKPSPFSNQLFLAPQSPDPIKAIEILNIGQINWGLGEGSTPSDNSTSHTTGLTLKWDAPRANMNPIKRYGFYTRITGGVTAFTCTTPW